MDKTVKNVVIGENNVVLDSECDAKIMSDMLSYIYGDKKTVSQIARNMNMHPLQVVLYLNDMVRNELLSFHDESTTLGSERYYYVQELKNNIKMKIHVNSENEKIRIASSVGNQLREVICSLEPKDTKSISFTISMIGKQDAEILIKEQKKLQKLMDEMEKNYKNSGNESDKYIMFSAVAPYKLDADDEKSDSKGKVDE